MLQIVYTITNFKQTRRKLKRKCIENTIKASIILVRDANVSMQLLPYI